MNPKTTIPRERQFPSKWFSRVALMLLIGGLILFICHFYFSVIRGLNQEKFSFVATPYFLLAVITGRFIALWWTGEENRISNKAIATISGFMGVSALITVFLAGVTEDADMPLAIILTGIPFTIVGLTAGMLIRTIRASTRKRVQVAETKAELSNTELQFLQSQLSPHFLFNTLNNMYGLSITQHEKVPGMILKLSDLLRYSVYDSKEELVPLKNEIAYLKDYMEFEKIRVGDKLDGEIFLEDITDANVRIAPLLLIVFVENAFKHSKNTTDQNIRIDITLKTWAGFILFSVRNSVNRAAAEGQFMKKESGVGLANVRKRLQLQYPGEHELSIQEGERYFQVNLKLKIR